jgi:hypothetical protein
LIKKFPLLGKSYTVHAILKILQKIREPDNLVRNPTDQLLIAMGNYVREKGAQFIIGFTGKSKQMSLENLCENNDISYMYLTTDLRYQSYGNHWTPEGHTFVSTEIFRYLEDGNFITLKAK